MAGIGGNLGTSDALINITYTNIQGSSVTGPRIAGSFTSVQNMYRVAPHVTRNIKNLGLTLEYEMTSADWGTGNFNMEDGLHDDTNTATNHRFLLMMMYFF